MNEIQADAENTAAPTDLELMWEAIERDAPPFVRDLTEVEIEEGYLLAPRAIEFNPQRTEYRWNDDFSGFIPIKLRWWDDASYIAYQSDCGECERDYAPCTPEELAEAEEWQREHDAKMAAEAAERAAWRAANPDEICF